LNKHFTPDSIAPPAAPYSHGVIVESGSQILYIAGQLGYDKKGNMPADFRDQAMNAFENLVEVVRVAGFSVTDIVKLNGFITDLSQADDYLAARNKHIGDHRPATTLVVVAGLRRAEWKLEVEGVAAKK
jgi:enamine deaminase RidA (YjgF/YER057c/UK114 family)